MKTKFTSVLASLVLVFLLSFTAIPVMAQCAMCKSSVQSNRAGAEEAEKRGNGLNTGILYIMCAPYILVGTVGIFWYRYSRKNK